MTSGALPALKALLRSSWNVAWWSSQLTVTPGYVASKRAIVSWMYWSNVGDSQNVQNVISAPCSTLAMTASAGSGARGDALADADGLGSADALGEPPGGDAVVGDALAGTAGVQAPTASNAVSASARDFLVVMASSLISAPGLD